MKRNREATGCKKNPLTYVEFYAGVGGWRMALEHAVKDNQEIQVRCQKAYDHSDLCIDVYRHNYGDSDVLKCNIAALSSVEDSEVWCLSPPCQPHTRQHDNQANERDDARSQSFWHLCDLLEQRQEKDQLLPRLIFLENVVHFETSESCARFLSVLTEKGNYELAEFHLTPTQVCLPNDRPRYFCVAVLRETTDPTSTKATCRSALLLKKYFTSTPFTVTVRNDNEKQAEPVKRTIHTSVPEVGILTVEDASNSLPPLIDFLDDANNYCNNTDSNSGANDQGTSKEPDLRVPAKVLERNAAWCFDIVTPESRRSSCFTSSYGRLVRGTGSIIYTGGSPTPPTHDNTKKNKPHKIDTVLDLQSPQERSFDGNQWLSQLDRNELRYFSGLEMARLMGFSSHFGFPADCTLKQQWKLIGNSVNSQLACRLIQLGLQAAGICCETSSND